MLQGKEYVFQDVNGDEAIAAVYTDGGVAIDAETYVFSRAEIARLAEWVASVTFTEEQPLDRD